MNIVKKIFFLLAFVLLNTVVNNAFADGVLKGTITSDWGNGFCYNFNVANTSGSNLTDWNVNFKLNTATSINSKWSGNFSNVSDIYTITPVDRNKTISANGSTDIGFCANGTDRPTSITLGSNTVNNSTTGTTNTTTTETLKDNLITKDGLSVNFVASSKRDGGYCRNITLKNTSSETISNWEISFLLDQAINGWSANYSKSGTKYTVKPMDWNKSINSNTQIEIGFCSVGKLFDKTQVIENVSFLSTTTPTTPTNSGSTTTTTTNSGSTTTTTNSGSTTTTTNSGSTTTTTNSGSTAITTNTSINFPAEKWVTKGIDLNGDGLADINMQNTPWNISSAYGSSKLEYDTNLKTYKYSHDFSNIVQVDPSGWVHGYPEVFVGKKPWGGDYTQGYTHLPKLIKEINSLNFTTQYNLNNISGGPINFAAEGWIVPDKNRSTNVSGNEIEYMIMFFKENTGPAGNAIGTFTTQIKVNGQSVNEAFTIYKARFAWDFFTFVPSKNYNGELIELDLAKFLPYIKQNISYNIDNYYLMNWEIGSEYGSPTVLNSKASWELKKFNLDVNSTAVNTNSN